MLGRVYYIYIYTVDFANLGVCDLKWGHLPKSGFWCPFGFPQTERTTEAPIAWYQVRVWNLFFFFLVREGLSPSAGVQTTKQRGGHGLALSCQFVVLQFAELSGRILGCFDM